jgi:hypothetical protein
MTGRGGISVSEAVPRLQWRPDWTNLIPLELSILPSLSSRVVILPFTYRCRLTQQIAPACDIYYTRPCILPALRCGNLKERSRIALLSSLPPPLLQIFFLFRFDRSLFLLGLQAQVTVSSRTSRKLVRFEAFTAVAMKNVVFWGYKTPARTSQETHYVSATEPSRLMLCKIWGFHGGDYEECRLLGHKTPVPTSQETHYVSATEPSQLMLCKIWSFHGSHYEECRLLRCYALWLL